MPQSGVTAFREDHGGSDERVVVEWTVDSGWVQPPPRPRAAERFSGRSDRPLVRRPAATPADAISARPLHATAAGQPNPAAAHLPDATAPRPADAIAVRRPDATPARRPEATPARRTVTIRGHGDERTVPSRSRSRRPERPYERSGFRADRAAIWAVLLCALLVLIAATTAHAATLHALAQLH